MVERRYGDGCASVRVLIRFIRAQSLRTRCAKSKSAVFRAEQKEAFGLQLANFNCEPASLADEGQRLLFLKNLEAAVALGKRLGGSRITVLSGDDTGEARGAQHASIVAGLREAAPMLEEEGFMVVLEASNRR